MWEETGRCSRAWVRAVLTRLAKREKTARLASPIARAGAAVVLSTRSRHCSRIAAERDPAGDGVRDIYEFGERR
jgi:hypothetical protein